MEQARGKEGERGQIPSFKTVELKELNNIAKAAAENGKYLFISDMSG